MYLVHSEYIHIAHIVVEVGLFVNGNYYNVTMENINTTTAAAAAAADRVVIIIFKYQLFIFWLTRKN